MPTAVRQAHFGAVPATYSRLPRDDEAYVMKKYSGHVTKCDVCLPPSHLCSKGRARALDVTQYVFNAHGQSYSVVDLNGNQRIEVEIPTSCEPVRGLLKAVERGAMRLKKSEGKDNARKATSYDKTYYIPPRRSASPTSKNTKRDLADDLEIRQPYYHETREQSPRYLSSPRPETFEPAVNSKRLSRSSTTRRPYSYVEREPSYLSMGSRGKLPVPSRNGWF